jgi:phage terminase large subunit GpA-like protein
MDRLIDELCGCAFSAATPPARLNPSDWASGRVVIADGLTPKYQVENAPWQREPLDTLSNADAKEAVFLAPIGTGKTTFMESGLAYIIAEDPGPTLLVGQTDDDLKDWAETRMDHVIRHTPECANLLPEDRHKKRKMQILFPHMSLFLTGANLSGLQSKSMRRVFCDEAWQYRPGMLNEARGRLHDRWNRQFFILSQAGVKGDDLDKAWQQSDQREFCFSCPECGTVQPWKWCNIVGWEDEGKEPIERAQAAYIKCENEECLWTCGDHTQKRRALAESAQYVSMATGLPGHIGFHYNVLCNWRKPLWEIVLLWIEAKEALKKGNTDPLRQFIQKRLAESWEEDLTDNRKELVGDGYSMSEYADGKMIEDEGLVNGIRFRFLTIDVQADHFWYVIRAWKANGDSQLLSFGRLETIDQADELCRRYQISPTMVAMDSGYNSDMVYGICARRNWTALKGSARDEYPWPTREGKNKLKPFQRFSTASSSNGGACRFAHWSSNRIKDILYAHRVGKSGAWLLPDDVSPEYVKQIDSEVKREVANAKTKQVEYRWVKTRQNNHGWDCESMQIVLALNLQLIQGFDI